METGELVTRWTVRFAVFCYFISIVTRRSHFGRVSWSTGCVAYLLHVLAAFHYYHHWSHDDAYESTRRQTVETTGLDWGGGLYVNYAFTLIWLLDVLWWWIAAENYLKRPRAIDWGVHLFLGFIVFNATVVFASGFSRWLGVAGFVLLPIVWLWPRKEQVNVGPTNHGRSGVDGGDHR